MDTLMNDDISASDASEKIKDILFAKSADKINTIKPDIASHLFNQDVDSDEKVKYLNPAETEEPSAETDVNLDQESEPEEEEESENSVTQTPSIGGAVLTNPG